MEDSWVEPAILWSEIFVYSKMPSGDKFKIVYVNETKYEEWLIIVLSSYNERNNLSSPGWVCKWLMWGVVKVIDKKAKVIRM